MPQLIESTPRRTHMQEGKAICPSVLGLAQQQTNNFPLTGVDYFGGHSSVSSGCRHIRNEQPAAATDQLLDRDYHLRGGGCIVAFCFHWYELLCSVV